MAASICPRNDSSSSSSSMVSNSNISMVRTESDHWAFSQGIPTDIVVEVREVGFPLHKFMLAAKSNCMRKLIMESNKHDLTRIDLSAIPGGPETFEKAAKFCYGVNFEITVHNVAPLRCAAEYLQMTGEGNLGGRTEDFLRQVAFTSLSGAVIVFKSCENLLPLAQDLNLIQQCVDVISAKACNEANFPSRSPQSWWAEELAVLDITFLEKILSAMRARGAKPMTLAGALITFAQRSPLRDLLQNPSGKGTESWEAPLDMGPSSESVTGKTIICQHRDLLESIVALLPSESEAAFHISFLCCLLRSALFLKARNSCINKLEKQISANLEHVTVNDLLVLSFTYNGERILDLESVRRIISGFVEKERSISAFNVDTGFIRDRDTVCSTSTAMHRVANTVDAYLGEIATYAELGISMFNGIAILVPKIGRKIDDDLYRAVDIYLKAHPSLDEIEREKACSVMDPLKLSYEARVHASQNKRLPVQVVLHALYYDQLKQRSGTVNEEEDHASMAKKQIQLQSDVALVRENEALRAELMKMKLYISDLQDSQGGTASSAPVTVIKKAGVTNRKLTFLSSMSKTLSKLNPFRNGSKDTSSIIEDAADITKPRRRRFSIS